MHPYANVIAASNCCSPSFCWRRFSFISNFRFPNYRGEIIGIRFGRWIHKSLKSVRIRLCFLLSDSDFRSDSILSHSGLWPSWAVHPSEQLRLCPPYTYVQTFVYQRFFVTVIVNTEGIRLDTLEAQQEKEGELPGLQFLNVEFESLWTVYSS